MPVIWMNLANIIVKSDSQVAILYIVSKITVSKHITNMINDVKIRQ